MVCNSKSSDNNSWRRWQPHIVSSLLGLFVALLSMLSFASSSLAQFKTRYNNLPSATSFGAGGQRPAQQPTYTTRSTRKPAASRGAPQGPAGVYPEFRSSYGVIRWIPDQMPLRVWVSNGQAIDSILDPEWGAPYINTDFVSRWPDVVADVISNPEKLASLPTTRDFYPEHRQAALEGINFWKPFQKEGLFSFELTDDPMEADIHVFFVHHFVGKQGMALFSNDIRGYTAKRSFPYKAIVEGKHADFKPVVIVVCTTEGQKQTPMPPVKMRAAVGHEFGHALGIEGHSKNAADLMSLYYGNGTLSRSDIATIRYLYKLTPDLIP